MYCVFFEASKQIGGSPRFISGIDEMIRDSLPLPSYFASVSSHVHALLPFTLLH